MAAETLCATRKLFLFWLGVLEEVNGDFGLVLTFTVFKGRFDATQS